MESQWLDKLDEKAFEIIRQRLYLDPRIEGRRRGGLVRPGPVMSNDEIVRASMAATEITREWLTAVGQSVSGEQIKSAIASALSENEKHRKQYEKQLAVLARGRKTTAEKKKERTFERKTLWLSLFDGLQKEFARLSDERIARMVAQKIPSKSNGDPYKPSYILRRVYEERRDLEASLKRTK